MSKKQLFSLIDTTLVVLLGSFIVIFPLASSSLTTDFFGIPKQAVLGFVSLVGLVLFGFRMIMERDIKVRRTPFNLPVIAFCITVFMSAIFAVNRLDAVINYVPLLFTVILYFLIINFLKEESSLFFATCAFVTGAVATSLLTVTSYFRMYLLPFSFTQVQTFSPVGPLLDSAIFLTCAFLVTIPSVGSLVLSIKNGGREKTYQNPQVLLFTIASLIILIGLITTVFELSTIQKPIILPLKTGFQTAFAAISQDAKRLLEGFLFGSGYGTYSAVFTRFKQPDFNTIESLWSLTFFKSSSFFLELLSTTGVLGVLSFIGMIASIGKELKTISLGSLRNWYSLSLLFLVCASFLLPFSPTVVVLFFMILALFAAHQGLRREETALRFYDLELHLVAFKKAVSKTSLYGGLAKLLPLSLFLLFVTGALFLGYYSIRYIASDISFEKSIVATSQNRASEAYDHQNNAIKAFYYRDSYHRVFAQTNLAIASFLAEQQNQNPSNPQNPQAINAVYTLTQQAINSARIATQIAPQTASNWTNLSSVYRSLIGFGQQAEQFAILANQQAIAVDPNNPQEYLNLGGIYYQLGQWENAQRQFQIAISLKPDYANAYYNLGHALESKGALNEALAQYLTVKSLVGDGEGKNRINAEIAGIQQKLGTPTVQAPSETETESTPSSRLRINTPQTQLPEQNPKVQIPPPSSSSPSARAEE